MLAGSNKKATLRMDFYPKVQIKMILTFIDNSNLISLYSILFCFLKQWKDIQVVTTVKVFAGCYKYS